MRRPETRDNKPPRGDPAGRGTANNRNGSYPKTALTAEGSVEIEVSCDRAGTFEPQIVPEDEARLEDGVATVIRPYLEAFTADVRCAVARAPGFSLRRSDVFVLSQQAEQHPPDVALPAEEHRQYAKLAPGLVDIEPVDRAVDGAVADAG